MSTEPSADGPTPRAVALARAWLWLAGMVWLIVGVIMLASSHDSSTWLAVLVVVFALGHFVLAHYGSRRVAVFFALFGS